MPFEIELVLATEIDPSLQAMRRIGQLAPRDSVQDLMRGSNPFPPTSTSEIASAVQGPTWRRHSRKPTSTDADTNSTSASPSNRQAGWSSSTAADRFVLNEKSVGSNMIQPSSRPRSSAALYQTLSA